MASCGPAWRTRVTGPVPVVSTAGRGLRWFWAFTGRETEHALPASAAALLMRGARRSTHLRVCRQAGQRPASIRLERRHNNTQGREPRSGSGTGIAAAQTATARREVNAVQGGASAPPTLAMAASRSTT